MKVCYINGGVFGSTGKIMFSLAEMVTESGGESLCVSPVTRTNKNKEPGDQYIKIGSYTSRRLSVLKDRITGYEGHSAVFHTHKLIKKIIKFNPDIIHLHNIHGSYINLPMLFKCIKEHNFKVVWTLHDCWAFTGHCPHFTGVGCDRWKNGCFGCTQYKEYPYSCRDNSKKMYARKRKLFCGIENMVLVTPSNWLAQMVKQSFLSNYQTRVIHNGLDLSVFKPTESDFRQKHRIGDRRIILGVSFGWNYKKGLDVFTDLAKKLDDSYRIVLVGTDNTVDRLLPDNIVSIHRTNDQTELAQIYTAADLFVNPTREETLSMVNLEALACGTPVVTFNTGGSPETVNEACGMVVEYSGIDSLKEEIIRICTNKPFAEEMCIKQAKKFDKSEKFKEYIELYERIITAGA